LGNPVISVIEDVISGVSAFIAIVLPVLAAIFFASLLGLFVCWRVRRNKRRTAGA
jgi:preprotein translocase subunit SecG